MNATRFLTVRKGLALLALVSVVVVLTEVSAVARLREENRQLQATALRQQNTTRKMVMHTAGEAAEIAHLRRANRNLLKLRNEVRQVREVPGEIAKLRAQIQQLQTRNRAGAVVPVGFIRRELMADAGVATPGATVQTYFWAITHGNLERLSQIVGGEMAREFSTENKEALAALSANIKRELDSFPGFRIAETQIVNADEAIVGIQTTEDGLVMRTKLQKIGNEWKLIGQGD